VLRRLAGLIPLTLWSVLRAQSLAVSTAAAAPLRDDSIYALRVDPAKYQGQDDVILLDEGTARLESDGRSSYTNRQVGQILTTKAVENWGELTFWYTEGRSRIVINRIRVIGPDGTVLHDGPAHQQDVSPSAESGDPVFSDRRGIQVTLAGIAPGTLVDYSYTLETVKPALPGDFLYYWFINGDSPVRRSRFTLDTPVELSPRLRVRNIGGTPVDSVIAGRRIRRWAIADIPAIAWQTYSGAPNAVVASIRVGSAESWRSVGAWYDSLAHDRYALTPEIVAAHTHELQGARTMDDSLRATYRWVAQDFRYVSLSLGEGSYQPRSPREVFESRFGDCKDKTVLFVTLARRMGVTSYPVLVRSDATVDSLQPSIKQFDHLIAAVERAGKTRYLDVTADLNPYDELPSSLQGAVGLALPAAGPKIVVLPASPADSNRHDEEIVGSFARDGRFVGRVTLTASGTEQDGLREELAGLKDQEASDRDETLRKHATSLYTTATVDSQHYSDGRDLAAPVQVSVWFHAPRVVGHMGTKYYFNLPIARFSNPENLTRIDAEGARLFPIDVASVNSPSVYRSSLQVELPEGWNAELPNDVSIKGPFGYYRAQYSQAGRMLRVSREMGGLRGMLPPDSLAALRAWLRGVGDDKAGIIVLSRGTGVDLVAAGTADSGVAGVGALPDVVLAVSDLTDAKVFQEGSATTGSEGSLNFSSTKPVETYHRTFRAQQMVFTAGGSQLATLVASAATYHTPEEARFMPDAFDLIDIPRFLGAYVKQMGVQQVTLGATRTLALEGIGDRAKGWVFEMVTPVATLDLAILLAARGRVNTALLAVGVKGVKEADLAALLRTMDERVRKHEVYLTAIPLDSAESDDVGDADSALAAATPLALNTVASFPRDSSRLQTRSASFSRHNGAPTYKLNIEGRSLQFPFGSSKAVEVAMTVTLHPTEADALKRVIATEHANPRQFVGSALQGLGQMGALAQSASEGDSTTLEAVVTTPRLGARSQAVRARLRGTLRVDVDEVVFARGKLTAEVAITRAPGASDLPAAASLARDMLQRMRVLEPKTSETAPPASLVAQVSRVVDAERTVDSLVEAKDIDGAFRVTDGAKLERAPVSFSASTWNSLCWWASLKGQAQRAMHACDAAVAPDTTVLGTRDSRGLGRALSGDLNGARDDFAYVVAHAAEGAFHDMRAAWLSKLRAGQNPFTEDVLNELRKE
jgi:transglutaminase-like putative cysteine protease